MQTRIITSFDGSRNANIENGVEIHFHWHLFGFQLNVHTRSHTFLVVVGVDGGGGGANHDLLLGVKSQMNYREYSE